ncbi:hypothetical protein PHET_06924 [Paragonimus heterotremus]|uniref:Prosaposin n=1 Tax=Paragonimus heterotremus TaxID=100268 RepID=A0A8J4WGI4_9TREM|nr:hypothetical protein PHET_06924 [Paragonimus heterotremus]
MTQQVCAQTMGLLVCVLLVLVFVGCGWCETYCDTPRLACRSVFTAIGCGKLSHCENQWKLSKWGKFRTDVSAECTYCLHTANLASTSGSAHRFCGLQSLSLTKKHLCEISVTSLKNVLPSRGNSLAICNLLTVCNSHTYLGDLNFSSPICEDCKKIIMDIRALIEDNATAVAITEKLNSLICDPVPRQFQDYCKETIKAHVPAVLHLIDMHINPEDICELVNLCPSTQPTLVSFKDLLPVDLYSEVDSFVDASTTHTKCEEETQFSWINRPSERDHPMWTSKDRLLSSASELNNVPSCEQCQAVFEQVRNTLKDPVVQEQLKKAVAEHFCSILPTFLRSVCDKAVEEDFDKIIQQMDTVSTKQACAVFGMCVKQPDVRRQIQVRVKPGTSLPGVCQLCELVIDKLVNLLPEKPTEEAIQQALSKVCLLVPQSHKKQCHQFVEQYAAKIVEAIIRGTAAEVICYGLGLCGPLSRPLVVAVPLTSAYCDTCKFLVTVAEHQLTQNQTEAQIKSLASRLCQVLPSTYVEECNQLVDKYTPLVLEYLTESMQPDVVCQKIGLCSPGQGNIHSSICLRGPSYWCSSPEAAILCNAVDHCERFSQTFQIEKEAQQRCETQDLEKICNSLELVAKCGKQTECLNRGMIHYLQMITGHLTPKPQLADPTDDIFNCTICAQLVYQWKLQRKLFTRPIINNRTCLRYSNKADRDQCLLILANRYKILEQLATSTNTIEDMCKKLTLCQAKHATALILACADGPSYWCASRRNAELCGTVHFCKALGSFGDASRDSKPVDTTLDIFGVNVCAWGATYWCQSEENARKCNALQHCKTHVWRDQSPVSTSTPQPFGVNPCTWGPAYWCADEKNAHACGPHAVKHCRRMSIINLTSNN